MVYKDRTIKFYENASVIIEASARVEDIGVVTFTPFSKNPPAPSFAAEFLSKYGVNSVHVRFKQNDWAECVIDGPPLDLVASLLRPARRRIAYGSSMGAFAALVFAARLGCDTAIAISPQAAITPDLVPWERRWRQEAATQKGLLGIASSHLTSAVQAHLIYDPAFELDQRHIDLIASYSPDSANVHLHKFYFSGHPSGEVLAPLGILSKLFFSIVRNGPSFNFQNEYRAKRATSSAVCAALLSNRPLMKQHFRLVRGYIEESIDRFQHMERILFLAARVFADQNILARAISLAHTCNELHGKPSIETNIMLARLYVKKNEIELAQRYYDTALALGADERFVEERDRALLGA